MKLTRSPGRGLGDLLVSAEMQAIVVEAAQRIRAAVVPPVDSGQYAAGLAVEVRNPAGVHHDRVVASVVATAPHSAAVEFGNHNRRAQYPLLRAVQAARR